MFVLFLLLLHPSLFWEVHTTFIGLILDCTSGFLFFFPFANLLPLISCPHPPDTSAPVTAPADLLVGRGAPAVRALSLQPPRLHFPALR